jgi:hypothetical protein
VSNLKKWRWAVAPALSLVVAIILSAGIAPSRDEIAYGGLRNWGRGELNDGLRRTFALRDSAQAYRLAWQLANTRERAAAEAPAPVGLTIRVDRDVPVSVAATLTRRLRAEFDSLTDAPRHAVIVRILVDSSGLVGVRRAIVIPATASGPCVLNVNLPFQDLNRVERRNPTELLGVCGLYAKFGAPGEGMTKFLTRTSLATAGQHTLPAIRPPFTDKELRAGHVVGYNPFTLACSVGREAMCRDLFEGKDGFVFLMGSGNALSPRRLTNGLRIAVFSDVVFQAERGARIAEVRASLGDDRFAMLWASKDEPAVEFARREGRSLESYISGEMQSPTASYHVSSAPRGLQAWIALALVAAFALLAVMRSPREYRP